MSDPISHPGIARLSSTHSSSTASTKVSDHEHEIPAQRSPNTAGNDGGNQISLTKTTTNGPVYSVFTPSQKHFIIFMASWAGFFSPVSATIYLPALNPLAEQLHVSNTLINLTLTSYMIFQGLAPAFIGALADNMGRRPAYTICFIIYIAANIGLALQDSYAALIVLRCVQSSGSSATIAMASAVVSDVATPSERGSYMGFTLAGSLLGPAIGPVIGGLLAQFLDWRAIFWFLVIFAGVFLAIFLIFFPETARTAVGNGSIAPQGWNMSLMNYLAIRKARKDNEALVVEGVSETSSHARPKRLTFPNPLSSLTILLDKQVALLLGFNALLFAAFYDITATVPSQFAAIYKFNDLQIGLCFLPFGFGSLLASLVNGYLLDWNFARWCRKLNLAVKKGRDMDLRDFPIERARLEIALPLIYVSCALLLIFGWVLNFEGPLAVLLVVLFLVSFTMGIIFNAISTLIVDFFPTRAASATAANNLLRCLLGAGATAVIVPMINAMGRGWTFTFLALVLLLASPMIWINLGKGMGWREERRLKAQTKTDMLESKKASYIEEGAAAEREKEHVVEGGVPEMVASMPRRHSLR